MPWTEFRSRSRAFLRLTRTRAHAHRGEEYGTAAPWGICAPSGNPCEARDCNAPAGQPRRARHEETADYAVEEHAPKVSKWRAATGTGRTGACESPPPPPQRRRGPPRRPEWRTVGAQGSVVTQSSATGGSHRGRGARSGGLGLLAAQLRAPDRLRELTLLTRTGVPPECPPPPVCRNVFSLFGLGTPGGEGSQPNPPFQNPPSPLLIEGAPCAVPVLCMRCAKSRLFSTTGSHGSQGPEFCTPGAVLS